MQLQECTSKYKDAQYRCKHIQMNHVRIENFQENSFC